MKRLGLVVLVLLAAGCNYQVKKSAGDAGVGPETKPTTEAITFAEVKVVLDKRCSTCHHHADDFKTYDSTMATGDVVAGNAAGSDLVTRLKNFGGDMPRGGAGPIPDEEAALIRDWINNGATEDGSAPAQQKPAEPAQPEQPAQPAQPAPAPQPDPVPAQPAPAPAQPAPAPAQPAPAPGQNPPPPAETVTATYSDLQSKVFSQKCTMCHSDAKKAAGFSLEHYNDIVSNARLIAKGNSNKSGLFVSVSGPDAFMPPKRAVSAGMVQPLTDAEKTALQQWIDAGALEN